MPAELPDPALAADVYMLPPTGPRYRPPPSGAQALDRKESPQLPGSDLPKWTCSRTRLPVTSHPRAKDPTVLSRTVEMAGSHNDDGPGAQD